ncbi:hypothetical protein [Fictibacillus sp. KU28468]|uniref:hypothetical protein n=1 Tax=Fictibacillus sp. KU28468 TaxID=2991053 RepID=UPI00223E72BC|nr:hypothetical protein [Fictibacillus sp. KU28468]UZJ80553.1 hypothetical protein OKX00_08930 [Fictibacillus sp. KU28468]
MILDTDLDEFIEERMPGMIQMREVYQETWMYEPSPLEHKKHVSFSPTKTSPNLEERMSVQEKRIEDLAKHFELHKKEHMSSQTKIQELLNKLIRQGLNGKGKEKEKKENTPLQPVLIAWEEFIHQCKELLVPEEKKEHEKTIQILNKYYEDLTEGGAIKKEYLTVKNKIRCPYNDKKSGDLKKLLKETVQPLVDEYFNKEELPHPKRIKKGEIEDGEQESLKFPDGDSKGTSVVEKNKFHSQKS